MPSENGECTWQGPSTPSQSTQTTRISHTSPRHETSTHDNLDGSANWQNTTSKSSTKKKTKKSKPTPKTDDQTTWEKFEKTRKPFLEEITNSSNLEPPPSAWEPTTGQRDFGTKPLRRDMNPKFEINQKLTFHGP